MLVADVLLAHLQATAEAISSFSPKFRDFYRGLVGLMQIFLHWEDRLSGAGLWSASVLLHPKTKPWPGQLPPAGPGLGDGFHQWGSAVWGQVGKE